MLSRFSMTQKLLITLLPLAVVILLSLVVFVRFAMYQSITEEAIQSTRNFAAAQGAELVSQLKQELTGVSALASAFKAREQFAPNERRAIYDRILRSHLTEHSAILSAWTLWEPDAFDGLDADYAGQPMHDETGRYLPIWFREGSGIEGEPLMDYEEPGPGDYYLLAKQTRKPVVLDPFWYPFAGEDILITSLVVPIIEQGQFQGVVGVDVAVSSLQEQVAQVSYMQGVSALFAEQGTIVGHPDPTRLGQSMAVTEGDFMGDQLQAAVEAVTQGQSFYSIQPSDLFAGEMLVVFEPLDLGMADGYWSFAMAMPLDEVLANLNQVLRQVLVMGGLSMLAFAALLVVLARSIAKPLEQTVRALENVASGEGDLTQRLPVQGKDEVARLSHSFNGFVEQLRSLIAEVAGYSEQLASNASSLGQFSQKAAQDAQQQTSETEQVAAAMDEMTATVQEVANHAQQASDTTKAVSREVEQGQEVIRGVAEQIGRQAHEIELTASKLEALEAASNEIEEVVTTIQNIAEQTNLLALNAAIEAARAGEQGRGFAVVADEVRSLANRTQESTEVIRSTIVHLQETTLEAVKAMQTSRAFSEQTVASAEEGLAAFAAIAEQTQYLEAMGLQIASTTEEQSATAEELAQNTSRIGSLAEEAAVGAQQTESRSQELQQLAANIHTLIQRFKY